MVPLLHHSLAARKPKVPAWPDLAKLFEMTTRRALWLTDLLQRVLKLLNDQGIATLPYKGPVLAQILYGDITMRQYTDLDILIRQSDVGRATSALAKIGLTPHLRLTPAEHKAYLASAYEFAFDGFGNANLVELQWRILPRFYVVDFDTQSLFPHAQAIDVSGMKVGTLGSEDLFLVLCVPAAKHLWTRLSWIYEIARLSASGQIDWKQAEREAGRLGISRIVGVSLRLAHDLFGLNVPSGFEPAADNLVSEQIAIQITGRLAVAEQPDTESILYFRRIMHLREGGWDKLRSCSGWQPRRVWESGKRSGCRNRYFRCTGYSGWYR